mmetsp:Transcript_21179/g.29667  ORF Transcript_21179/g.29667 Transcript_21179/m.29667 type:complete len:1158 (+) Transcript_21179:71-3544(+)
MQKKRHGAPPRPRLDGTIPTEDEYEQMEAQRVRQGPNGAMFKSNRNRANTSGSTRGAFLGNDSTAGVKIIDSDEAPPVAQVTVDVQKKKKRSKSFSNPNPNANEPMLSRRDSIDYVNATVANMQQKNANTIKYRVLNGVNDQPKSDLVQSSPFASNNGTQPYQEMQQEQQQQPLTAHPLLVSNRANTVPKLLVPNNYSSELKQQGEALNLSFNNLEATTNIGRGGAQIRNQIQQSKDLLSIPQSTSGVLDPNMKQPHTTGYGAMINTQQYYAEKQVKNQPSSSTINSPESIKKNINQSSSSQSFSDKSTTPSPCGSLFSFFDEVLRSLFYDPDDPEFTSLQQNSWAVILGIIMGIFTAKWGQSIEYSIKIVWETIPNLLLKWGVFTDLDGRLPLPHYLWICPAICGGILAFISAILPTPIPGQNEWIVSLHTIGIMDHTTFLPLILISTAGMASGLSLGPELPLVLSAGMVGSKLALMTNQSVLSARVMNLTAGAAAIGGFFGFPMAGALFVLELPHRMGLQYFEALSPATIASITAVLVNRMVTGDDVKGYFTFPFLTATLPSHIFYVAIVYGIVGSIFGIIYADTCLYLKKWVHDWFHAHHHDDHSHNPIQDDSKLQADQYPEDIPLVDNDHRVKFTTCHEQDKKHVSCFLKVMQSFQIENEPIRAAVAGTLAGGIVGFICMLIPHNLFWGEAQLQTLIDKGETPLPVFGQGDEPTAILTAYGYCLEPANDDGSILENFGTTCAGMIVATKIVVIGLSLGTGIVGGHFWGPLFVGCAASQFFTGISSYISNKIGFGESLSAFPCVAILCIMGSTHIVTFRAHMAIMLILTLTIRAFTSEFGKTSSGGGDYSAVFPLLVVSCFVPLMFTRSTIFYKEQRCRGDIIASPEVLCEPRKEGTPIYPVHNEVDETGSSFYSESEDYGSSDNDDTSYDESYFEDERNNEETDIKINAQMKTAHDNTAAMKSISSLEKISSSIAAVSTKGRESFEESPSPVGSRKRYNSIKGGSITGGASIASNTASSLRSSQLKSKEGKRKSAQSTVSSGRRSRESSIERKLRRSVSSEKFEAASRCGSRTNTPNKDRVSRVNSFGEVQDFQPSLMSQARERASSIRRSTGSIGVPPKVSNPRKNSTSSVVSSGTDQARTPYLEAEDSQRE